MTSTDLLDTVFGGEPNLSLTQRSTYVVLGLGLAAAATQPRPNPLLNVLALVGGSYLALSGYMGRCPAKAALFDGNMTSHSIRSHDGPQAKVAGATSSSHNAPGTAI